MASSSGPEPRERPSAREWIDAWRIKSRGHDGKDLLGSGAVDLAVGLAKTTVAVSGLLVMDKVVFASLASTLRMTWLPSPLLGMFLIFAALSAGDVPTEGDVTVTSMIESAFAPGLEWIGRWLPLFYVPSLVVLPVILRTIDALMLARIVGIIVLGLLSSLVVTAKAAFVIRDAVKTKLKPVPPAAPVEPFSMGVKIFAGVVAAISLAAASILGSVPATAAASHPAPLALLSAIPRTAATAFLIACTVGGYIAGCELPAHVRKVLHPIIFTAIAANAGAVLLAIATGTGYIGALRFYLLKGSAGAVLGAGDVLMAFLGSVILSFGFRIFSQRDIMSRHRYEVFGCVLVSAVFSLFVTVAAGRLVGLEPMLTRAIAPRSVTVALALPIASTLGVPPEAASITAAAVVMTGLLGAAVAQQTLDAFGFKGDPIARGMATAGSAHGLGTAALARDEPEALPFCALAYGLMGIVSTLLVSAKPVADLLIAIAG